MRETWLPILFFSGFVTAGLGIAPCWWMVMGVHAHSDRRDPNAVWATMSSRYRPHMIAFFSLWVLTACLMIACTWVARQP
jgi:hypothetical protein